VTGLAIQAICRKQSKDVTVTTEASAQRAIYDAQANMEVERMASNAMFAEVAALAGDPARAGMLHALMDGRALTASELAHVAGITPQTASGHLTRMTAIGLLSVEKQGRHRYHRSRPQVWHTCWKASCRSHLIWSQTESDSLLGRAMRRSGELALATTIWPASLVLRSLMLWWGKDMRS